MKSIKSKLLISLGIVILLFSGLWLYRTYSLIKSNVQDQIQQQLSLALHFDLAIRDYVAKKIRPVMYELVEEDEFIRETMSTSYIARKIFERVRERFPDYIIKFSAENPRNPVNLAGPEELNMIQYFNDNPRETKWTGEVSISGKKYLARFSARRTEEGCLRCHGHPDDAPASLLERYGSKGGFHQELGKIVGLDTIAIPTKKVSELLWAETARSFIFIGSGVLLLFIATAFVLKFVITDRIGIIAEHFVAAEKQTEGKFIERIEISGNDEIAIMAGSFNKLANRINEYYRLLEKKVAERTETLSRLNEKLMREVDERRLAEEALTFEREQLLSIFESINEVIYVSDPQSYEILYVNNALKDKFKKDPTGSKCYKEFQGLDSPCDFCTNEIILKNKGEPHIWEFHNPLIDGDYLITDRIIRWPDGRDVRFEVAIDITERKRAEMALRESEERFRTLVETTSDWVWEVDLSGTYTYVSPMVKSLLGYDPEDIIGKKKPFDLMPEHEAERMRATYRDIISSRKPFERLENVNLHKNGYTVVLESSGVPIYDMAGNLTGFRGIDRDITERKLAEQKLIDYQNQLRSLASEISLVEERERRRIAVDLHDRIGQILSICKIKVGVLNQQISSTDQSEALREIDRLIGQVINETRSLTFELSPPVLYELGFESAVEWLLENFHNQHGLEYKLESDGNFGLLGEDLRILLFRAVRELVFNVIKHANTKNVNVSIVGLDNQIEICVEDSGSGFDVSTIDTLPKGTRGYGIFSIRERLEHLGGSILITSKPGNGTIVQVVAPLPGSDGTH